LGFYVKFMYNRKLIYGIILSLFAMAIILGIIVYCSFNSQNLKIIFFDVGQGDAVLISQGSNQLLIDGGKDGRVLLEKLGKYIPFWDRKIEIAIATHPDADHIGGLVDAAKAYEIENVIETGAQSDSQVYSAWEKEIANSQKIEAAGGVTINFPDGAKLETFFPFLTINAADKKDSNANSVVEKLTFEHNSFLFTGDLPGEQEQELIKSGADLRVNVLKVAHHGSRYSTSQEFLDAVNPEEAVISVGKNNSYGHPAQEVLDRLNMRKIKIWRTDEAGDIIYECSRSIDSCLGQLN